MTDPFKKSDFLSELFSSMDSSKAKLRRNFDRTLDHLDKQWQAATEQVRGLFGTTFGVDEMALYFSDESLLWTTIQQLVKRDWELFNFAEDQVQTRPIASDYAVEYWFMRKGGVPYRLELMRVPDGFSPYHTMLDKIVKQLDMPASFAHASFKVSNEMTYANAVRVLASAGYELLQHCESSYGRFSYFAVTESAGMHIPALKPRINTRDGGADSGN